MYTRETVGLAGRFIWRYGDCGELLLGREGQKSCSAKCRTRAWRARKLAARLRTDLDLAPRRRFRYRVVELGE
jgi:hypothetical protein